MGRRVANHRHRQGGPPVRPSCPPWGGRRPDLQQLRDEKHLAGLSPSKFSVRAAHYLGELNALHPFREGNGRAQREFVSHLARATGFYVAWEDMKQPAMLQASIESFK